MYYSDLILCLPEEWRPFFPWILIGILVITLIAYFIYEHFKYKKG